MKNKLILSILFLLMCSYSYAQNNKDIPQSDVSVVAQYKPSENKVELRFFADQKSVLYQGIKNGYLIERAEIITKIKTEKDLNYLKIATVKPFTESQWTEVSKTTDADLKDRLEVAKSFYDNILKPQQVDKLGDNLEQLMNQKNAGDFEFVMLLMSAIQKPKVAFALGLGFNDATVKPNTKYVYRVSLATYDGPYKIIEVPYLITTNDKEQALNRKIDINVGDTKLGFSWVENDMISGVMVERKNKNTGLFEPLNDNPKYSLSENSLRNGFGDSGLTNYQTYEYNFYGFNAFGEKILFGNVKAMPKDLTPPKSPIMKSAKHISPDEVQINWQIPTPLDSDLKGFNIMRGKTVDGEFTKLNTALLNKLKKSFIDKKFDKKGANYYVVQAIDTAGNTSRSFSSYVTLIDTIAPKIPKFSTSKIDSLGVITLNIKPNKEHDLMGYRLFMANDPEHEFMATQEKFNRNNEIPIEERHIFKDTVVLKTLTPYIYYKVKALDFHHNQSDFSEIIKIKLIDITPPTTPVFKNVIVAEDNIELHFSLSQSKDVLEHILYRKEDLKARWVELSKLKKNQTSFIDKGLRHQKYFYAIRAKDNSNLYSEYSVPVYGKPYDNGKRSAITNFKIQKDKNKHILSWDYSGITANTYFIIYRSNKNGKLVQYKRVDTLEFIEKESLKKHDYAVRVFTKDGGSSKMSTPISLH